MRFMDLGRGSVRGFVAGAIFGMIVGGVGLGSADIPHKAWDQFSKQFHVGYIVGFYDAATYARNLDPDGFFDKTYPVFKDAKWSDFVHGVADIYAKEENKDAGSARALALAAIAMKEKFKVYGHFERFRDNYKNGFGVKVKRAVGAASAENGDKPDRETLKPAEQHKPKSGDVSQDNPSVLIDKGPDKKASRKEDPLPKSDSTSD